MRVVVDFIKKYFRLLILKNLLFGLGLLFFCRLIWLICNHFWLNIPSNFEIYRAFVIGIYLDLPVLAWFYLPLWLWLSIFPKKSNLSPTLTRIFATIPSFAILFLTGVDCAYSAVIGRRSGTDLFLLLQDKSNHFAPYILEYWWAIGLLLLATWVAWKLTPTKGEPLVLIPNSKHRFLALIYVPLFVGLWILCVRGGLRIKPVSSMDAAEFVHPSLAIVASSTPLQMLSTFGQNAIPEYHFMSDAQAEKLVFGTRFANPDIKKNIVLIIVESLGRDYTGFLNGQPFTPFLDSLSKLSTNFRFCYANGVKSVEMVPSIFCGIPSMLEGQFINSPYAVNQIENSFKAFQKSGYSTAFYHGASNGTMRFQAFLAQTGMNQYYGMDEYPSEQKTRDFDGNWGIFDEPYLQYFGSQLSKMKQPFFASVFTVSSHHPYRIPLKYKGKLPVGRLPIHQTIAYADAALRTFFKEISTKDWFHNTVFVITGDHTSFSKNAYFYSETGHYEVPFLIYQPNQPAKVIDKTVSQCDIIPTVSSAAGVNANLFGMGRSAFDSAYFGYSIHRSNSINFIVQYPYTLGLNDKGEITDFYTRLRNETQVKHLPQEGAKFLEMSTMLKAQLQVFSSRLRNNHWYW